MATRLWMKPDSLKESGGVARQHRVTGLTTIAAINGFFLHENDDPLTSPWMLPPSDEILRDTRLISIQTTRDNRGLATGIYSCDIEGVTIGITNGEGRPITIQAKTWDDLLSACKAVKNRTIRFEDSEITALEELRARLREKSALLEEWGHELSVANRKEADNEENLRRLKAWAEGLEKNLEEANRQLTGLKSGLVWINEGGPRPSAMEALDDQQRVQIFGILTELATHRASWRNKIAEWFGRHSH